MNSNTIIHFRNPAIVKKAGMTALKNELGIVGTTYFIRQFGIGYGDYTAEREQLLEGITLDEVIASVRKIDEKKA